MKDLLGKKFDKLTVSKFVWFDKYHCAMWECKCDCWKTVTRKSSHLLEMERKWSRQSCWCGRRKAHLMVNSKFYRKYNNIRSRCEREYADSYSSYWAKGIKCERRRFSDFYDDMYESYLKHCKEYWEENTTIDRIDNSKNYCKENCRWATIKEQANNKTNNRIFIYNWEAKTLALRAETLWLTYRTLYQRLYKWIPFDFIVEHPEVTHVSEYRKSKTVTNNLKSIFKS